MFLSKGESFKKYFHDNSKVNWIYLAREFETFSRYKKIYNQIRFIDEQGKEKIRVDYNDGVPAILPRSKLQNKSSRYYFKKSIKLNNYEVYVSPLDLNIENDLVEIPYNPMIRFATPIFDGYGKKRGILVLNYSANELLNKLRDILSFGKGEAMMLNNQGYWLISEHIDKQWGFMLDKPDERFATSYPDQWQEISRNKKGEFKSMLKTFIYTTAYPLKDALEFTQHQSEFLHGHELSPRIPLPKGHKADDYYWKLLFVMDAATFQFIYNERLKHFFSLLLLLSLASVLITLLFVRLAKHDHLISQKLKKLATTDYLTGAYSRGELFNIGHTEFSRVKRYNRDLSVIMIDADYFKEINDNYGHHAGDIALKELAKITQNNIREQDSLGRFGGEEFVILMPEETSNGAIELAQRIRKNIENNHISYDNQFFQFTISIGISVYKNTDKRLEDIIQRADKALYQAKEQGRNKVVLYE
ncbi:MAG: sensor domain-containing diguanylate cyclase [gamma proteobacterium symbiont of Lucinoma myriamae]|nr:sensor domain-containing diguanylate cyclase [gamma proteobacterium symbiont of Lucinoma myriamae]